MGNYNPVRIGIVGAGVSGSQVHLPVLAANSEVVIEWICDLDLEKAKSIAGRFAIPQTFAEIDQCPDVAGSKPLGCPKRVFVKKTKKAIVITKKIN